jgi:hypothetical protein
MLFREPCGCGLEHQRSQVNTGFLRPAFAVPEVPLLPVYQFHLEGHGFVSQNIDPDAALLRPKPVYPVLTQEPSGLGQGGRRKFIAVIGRQ